MLQLHTITLQLEPNPNGVFTVTSPDVPGLVTEGTTPEEILRNVQEALDALTAARRSLGQSPLALPPVARDRNQTVALLVTA
jgi:antitoxin HicB